MEGNDGGYHAGVDHTGQNTAQRTKATGNGDQCTCKAQTNDDGLGGDGETTEGGGQQIAQHDGEHIENMSATGSDGQQADDTANSGASHGSAGKVIITGNEQTKQTDVDQRFSNTVIFGEITFVAGALQHFAHATETLAVHKEAADNCQQRRDYRKQIAQQGIGLTNISVGGDLVSRAAIHECEQQDTDESGHCSSVVQCVASVQIGTVLAQDTHQEAGNGTQRDAQQDLQHHSTCHTVKRRISANSFTDEGRQGGGEDRNVYLTGKRDLCDLSEQPGAEDARPDVHNIHAKEAEADGQEKGHERCAIQLKLGYPEYQHASKTHQSGIQKGTSGGAQLEVVHGQLGGRTDNLPQSGEGLAQVSGQQCRYQECDAVAQHDTCDFLCVGRSVHDGSSLKYVTAGKKHFLRT